MKPSQSIVHSWSNLSSLHFLLFCCCLAACYNSLSSVTSLSWNHRTHSPNVHALPLSSCFHLWFSISADTTRFELHHETKSNFDGLLWLESPRSNCSIRSGASSEWQKSSSVQSQAIFAGALVWLLLRATCDAEYSSLPTGCSRDAFDSI